MINAWLQTFRGGRFYPARPADSDIDIESIAHALANTCRFGGHCREFYSVAQHSVLVASLLPRELKLCGLLHDASEAYLGDIPKPLKVTCLYEEYREVEAETMQVVAEMFGLPWPMPITVKQADLEALAIEAQDLMPQRERDEWAWLPAPPLCSPIYCMPPSKARKVFLDAYEEYNESLTVD